MKERKAIGQILIGLGRLSEEDCARAVEHQKAHGGFFGEALVALGIVSDNDLEFGLASQYDLPYVFPDAESVDPNAVALVSPEWALAHLTFPIMKTSDTVTVVVESPLKTGPIEELQNRTDLQIELALASPQTIRELIRQVYARGTAAEEPERPVPMHLMEAFAEALEVAAPRFGISTRGPRAWVWWVDAGTLRRRPLEGFWEEELERVMDPSPRSMIKESARAVWEGHMDREGVIARVEVRYLGDESGQEFLLRPIRERSLLRERFPPPSEGILSEVQMLARSGSARFVVTTDPPELGHEVMPHLPTLLLDPSWRSIYINAQEQTAADEAFSLNMPGDPEGWATELETLRAFHFDVVTVDLTGNQEEWASSALDVASVAFLLWPSEDDLQPAYDAGIRWELHVARSDGNELEWTLEPLHAPSRA